MSILRWISRSAPLRGSVGERMLVVVALVGAALVDVADDPSRGDSAGTPSPTSSRGSIPSPPPPVVTDGRFEDWAEVEALLDDPEDAPPDAAVDLGAVRLRDEPSYLHLDLGVGRPVNALGLRGTVRVVLDADADPATGALVDGLSGTDAVVTLSSLEVPRGDGYGLGASIRAVGIDGPGPFLPAGRAGLIVAPTQASDRLELRLDRGLSLGGPKLLVGEAVRLRVLYQTAAGEVLDATDIGRYPLVTGFEPPPPPARFDLARSPGSFRVVVWNVAGRGLGDDPGPFARVLAAIGPDVVLLDEAHGSLTEEELDRFFASIDGAWLDGASFDSAARDPAARPSTHSWSWVMGESGARQRGVVASRAPLRPVSALVGPVPYPEGSLERLTGELGVGRFGHLARVESRAGLAVAGAWVAPDGAGAAPEAGKVSKTGEILFVPVDLQSRGYLGSPEDRLRALQAEVIRQRVKQVLEKQALVKQVLASRGSSPGATRGATQGATQGAIQRALGIVVAGDLNLVGGWEPLERLVAGLDLTGAPSGAPSSGTDLEVAECPTLDGRSWATWRATSNPDSRFSPGRLDFQLYSSSTLEQVRGFAFDAGALPASQRRELGLEDDDSRVTSDHLPVVVDYRWRPLARGADGGSGSRESDTLPR